MTSTAIAIRGNDTSTNNADYDDTLITYAPDSRISRTKPGTITAPTLHWGGHPALVIALIAGAPTTLGLLIIISLLINS